MLRNNYFGEIKTHYKLYKCGKNWAVMGISLFSLGLGMLVTSQPVSADQRSGTQSQPTPVNQSQPTTPAKPVNQSQPTTPTTPVNQSQPTTPAKPVNQSQPTPQADNAAAKAETTSASKALATDKEALTHVTKDNFLAYFSLNGSATYDQNYGIVTITPDENDKVGNFSLKSKIDVNTNFTLTGKVNLGSNSPFGADGIGFAFHNGNTTDIGNAGGNLGIGGLQNALGFKLDTWTNVYQAPQSDKNGSQIDPTDSHGFGWNKDSMNAPYGTFVNTDDEEISAQDGTRVQRWWAKDVDGTAQQLNRSDVDGQFHDFTVDYHGDTRTLTIKYTETGGKILTWTTKVSNSYQAMAMIVSASTGGAKNLQQFKIISFDFKQAATVNVKYVDTKGNQIAQGQVKYQNGANVNGTYTTGQLEIPGYTFARMDDGTATGVISLPATGHLTKAGDNGTVIYVYTANHEAAKVTYIDDKTGKTLSAKALTGDYGSTDPYRTGDTIADYEKQGYQLVSDNYPTNGVVYNQDGTVQSFEVHLTHGTTPVGPNNPQTPGTPINPDNPDGPKWPEGTDKSSVTQTVIRTVNYLDKQTGKVVAKQITEQVTYNRTAIVDKVIGQIIGYSTTGGDTVDQTDGDKAWTAVDNKSDWDSVTSPDLSSKGYLAPDLATVAQQTVTPGDKDVTVNVYYDHDVVPVNPTNPQTPGTPINPDDPDSPKWPAGTDKNSLTTDVHQTIHYQYGDGSQAAPDKTDSTTFDHQVEIDKVTGEIVKDDGWTAENGKTSFDSKNSPVIPGYTASKPASDSVDGLTQDSKDNVQTIIYTANQEAAKVTYIDDKTGKTLSAKDLTGDYGSTDPYRTGDTIADYEKQGYQLVSDNYPTKGVVYNQDGTVQSFEVHLTHGTTQTSESQTVNETIHYVYKNGDKATDDYQATPLNFTRTVTTDKVTGKKTYGSWSADQSFAAVTSPAIKGYTPDQAEIGSQTVSGDSSDLDFTVVYAKNAPTITTESKTINETIHYVYKDGTTAHDDYVAKPVEFTREVSTDAVTGEKTYGLWSADQSFAAVTSPELKGYTADKAQIDKQTVNGDSKDLEFTVTYTKTPVAGGNVTAKYVDENGNPIADDVIASGNVGDPYSTTQKDVPGYTFKEVQGNPTGSFTDQDQTVTYVYTKNPATDNNGGTGLNQPGKPGNGTDTGNSSSNQPGNPSQPSNATNNGVINTSTNTGSKVNNGAVNSPELPQTGENNSQSQTMSFIGILLAMFGSLLGFLGIKKRRND